MVISHAPLATGIGVDPHPGSHTAAALDPNGMLLDNLSVSNDQAGLANLKRWALGFRAKTCSAR
ncbi:MAG: hypothetical protein KGZ57_00660 [Dethiobacter sp.]|nr:hypothetical protein [Dethiobacter sp.]